MGDAGALFESEKVWKLLLRITPPVMLAQLIQALYNIVDSYFVGRYSGNGLTALSVIFPLQLIITALAVGTGVGLNTQMSRLYARRRREEADAAAGAGMVLAVLSWLVFAVVSLLLMRPYVRLSANTPEAVDYAVTYGNIVCGGSLGIFLESCWTKVHQAGGNMKLPMAAQIAGALTNIVLDPILIFGIGPVPELGVAGAAIATVAGQFVAAAITGVRGWRRPPALKKLGTYARPIYRLGYPSILMQSLYTVYIVALNVILAGFCDEAVTVLGLYYKLQTFFFIPLMGLETCIVPVLSYNYTRARYDRCREIMRVAFLISSAFMLVGTLCFWLIHGPMIGLFSRDAQVLAIGVHAFRLIGLSFLPAVLSLLFPVFFQAIGMGRPSVLLSLTRQIFCLIPIFWLLSLLGLSWTWLAFLLSECITDIPGILLYCKTLRQWKEKERGVQTT